MESTAPGLKVHTGRFLIDLGGDFMRMSKLFSQTLRETPADTEVESHQLLVRAGFIHQLAAGIFSYLPLARRVLTKIENIMRQEIDAIGGQEITMPVVHPAEIWQESGRWYKLVPRWPLWR
jgi:prolyl-tRNA synthetase